MSHKYPHKSGMYIEGYP